MGRADLFGGLRSATKIDRGRRCLGRDGGAACAAVIAPVIGLVATAPHGLEHFKKLSGARIALVMFQIIPQRALLKSARTADHMQVQTPVAEQLQGGCPVGAVGGQFEAGAHGQQKAQAAHFLGQHGGDQPRVFETAGGRHHDAVEVTQFGRPHHLAQVVEGGRAFALLEQPDTGQAAAGQVAAVAVGGQEPVNLDGPVSGCGHVRRSPCAGPELPAGAGPVHQSAARR